MKDYSLECELKKELLVKYISAIIAGDPRGELGPDEKINFAHNMVLGTLEMFAKYEAFAEQKTEDQTREEKQREIDPEKEVKIPYHLCTPPRRP